MNPDTTTTTADADPITTKKKSKPSTVPNPTGEVCTLALRVADGVAAQGAAAGVKFATAAEILEARTVTLTTEAQYQAVLSVRSSGLQASLNQADAAGRKFISDTKKVLAIALGDIWSQAWAETGYLNGTLKTPSTLVERETLLHSLFLYLTKHPELEAVAQGVTAARAGELHQALTAANKGLDSGATSRKELRSQRDKAKAKLRKMLSGVIGELRNRLPIDSPLWDSFGLTAPKPRPRRPRAEKKPKASKAKKGTARTPANSAQVELSN